MPHRQLPNSAPTVLQVLTTARDTCKNTPAAARAITADQWAQLDAANPDSLLSRGLKQYQATKLDLAAQAPLTSAIAQTAARLSLFVSHFHQVLDLGITRGTFASGAREYYGRDINATTLPSLSSYADILKAANAIVEGETARATAEAAGVRRWGDGVWGQGTWNQATSQPHIPMALPSAAEVQEVRDAFIELRNQVQTAETATNREQEAFAALYPELLALATDIIDTVEFYYRHDPDPASRRAKCAQWGIVYIYDVTDPQPPPPSPTK